MPDTKLVIRRLPPSMNEDEFLKHVSPLPDHDYFCFFDANSIGLGPHSFSRAYINFINTNDTLVFKERFDNYVFLDKDGQEYPAVVEQSMWHKSPKDGPFYNSTNSEQQQERASGSKETLQQNDIINDNDNWIEQDSDYLKFIEDLQAQKKRP